MLFYNYTPSFWYLCKKTNCEYYICFFPFNDIYYGEINIAPSNPHLSKAYCDLRVYNFLREEEHFLFGN